MSISNELSSAAATFPARSTTARVGRNAFNAGRPMRGAVQAALLDTIVAFGVLAVVILAPHIDSMPNDLEAALSIRITVRNLLLLAVLGCAWPLMFRAWGLYHVSRLRSESDEIRGVCAACATGALLVASIGTLTISGGLPVARSEERRVGT